MRTDHLEDLSGTAGLDLGHRFVAALAAKDRAALTGIFGAEVDFQAMTPRRSWEARTGAAVVDDVILGQWFDPGDVIDLVESAQTGLVGARTSLGYRDLPYNNRDLTPGSAALGVTATCKNSGTSVDYMPQTPA